jgi:Flp pilus assembly pilin Flp
MKAVRNLLGKLVRDERGGEVLEYALVATLVVIGAIAFISLVGGKVATNWTNVNNGLP